jgi:hypothetical protein
MTVSLAPIALFVYNRPRHTRKTLDALARDSQAGRSDLHIFSDAARTPADAGRVEEVRRIIRSTTGFQRVRILERSDNFGLSRSIIDGVSALCHDQGRVIVMEDDLVVSPQFLTFMNQALDRYRDEPRAMQIAGSMFPVADPDTLPQSFFSRLAASWGWATWKRAWDCFQADVGILFGEIESRRLEHAFDIDGSYPYTSMLRRQASGSIDSWAVRWYASMFLTGGLCLRPARSLVHNIGFDGSGVHCGSTKAFDVQLSEDPVCVFPDRVEECREAIEAIAVFFRSCEESSFMKVVNRAKAWLRRPSLNRQK